MSLIVKIDGQESFEVSKDCVQKVKYRTNIPVDSNARTKDVGCELEISGKILVATDGDPFDSTRQMTLWSVVPAESAAAYRQVTVEIVEAGIVERKYEFPRAFVIEYKENFGNDAGTGTFHIVIKQKKDKLNLVNIEGGYVGA